MLLTRNLAGAAVLGAALVAGAATGADAANILLSNDDGFDAPGIQTLRTALKKAGHTVTLVAPSGNRSGSSAALTFTPFTARKVSAGVYSVDTSPATSVIFGVTVVLKGKAPDLIVSGINAGANIGPSTVISGTVGNVIAAIAGELKEPVPGVAFSTNLVDSDPASAANKKHFADVAEFAARLVDRLTKSGGVRGIRADEGLNVNYPALAPAQVKGVAFGVQGRANNFAPAFTKTGADTYVSSSAPVAPTGDVKGSDTVLLNKGFITVVPIDGDYTAPSSTRERVQKLLGGLTP